MLKVYKFLAIDEGDLYSGTAVRLPAEWILTYKKDEPTYARPGTRLYVFENPKDAAAMARYFGIFSIWEGDAIGDIQYRYALKFPHSLRAITPQMWSEAVKDYLDTTIQLFATVEGFIPRNRIIQ